LTCLLFEDSDRVRVSAIDTEALSVAALLVVLTSPLLATLGVVVVIAAALLKGWSGWLSLKREELQMRDRCREPISPGARIEMADVRERLRKLEAIASGVDP
jgi:hypothetical protein